MVTIWRQFPKPPDSIIQVTSAELEALGLGIIDTLCVWVSHTAAHHESRQAAYLSASEYKLETPMQLALL